MSKVITLVKNSGLAPDEFRTYWRDEFLASLLALPEARENLVQVVHNHVLPSSPRGDNNPALSDWAGAALSWYYDIESAHRFLQSPQVVRVIASHAEVIPEVVHLHVREINGWDLTGGKPAALKMISFFLPRPDSTRAEAQLYWSTHHLRETARLGLSQRLVKYVQNHTFPDHVNGNPMYNFAGGPEMWFESQEDANEMFADPALLAELKSDEVKITAPDGGMMFLVEEESVFSAR